MLNTSFHFNCERSSVWFLFPPLFGVSKTIFSLESFVYYFFFIQFFTLNLRVCFFLNWTLKCGNVTSFFYCKYSKFVQQSHSTTMFNYTRTIYKLILNQLAASIECILWELHTTWYELNWKYDIKFMVWFH